MPADADPRRSLRKAPFEGDVVGRLPQKRRPAHDDDLDEGPSPEDIERFGGVTRTCPNCGKEVFDDVAVCYHCGHALDSREDAKGPPTWVIVTTLAVLLGFLALYLFR